MLKRWPNSLLGMLLMSRSSAGLFDIIRAAQVTIPVRAKEQSNVAGRATMTVVQPIPVHVCATNLATCQRRKEAVMHIKEALTRSDLVTIDHAGGTAFLYQTNGMYDGHILFNGMSYDAGVFIDGVDIEAAIAILSTNGVPLDQGWQPS
jgi:hypothetical protein